MRQAEGGHSLGTCSLSICCEVTHTHTPPLGLKVIRVWWYWVHFSSYTFLAFLTMYLYFFSFNVTWGDLNLLSHSLPDLSESSLSRTSL